MLTHVPHVIDSQYFYFFHRAQDFPQCIVLRDVQESTDWKSQMGLTQPQTPATEYFDCFKGEAPKKRVQGSRGEHLTEQFYLYIMLPEPFEDITLERIYFDGRQFSVLETGPKTTSGTGAVVKLLIGY